MADPDRFVVPPPIHPADPIAGAPSRRLRWIVRGVLLTPLILLGLWSLTTRLFFSAYKVTSPAMEHVLRVDDRILVTRGAYTPKVGDVVTVHTPALPLDLGLQCAGGRRAPRRVCLTPGVSRSSRVFVQRIAGGPGDRLRLKGGRLLRNGRLVDGPSVVPCRAGAQDRLCDTAPFVVPAGTWFTLGDHREEADDGRYWGPVAADAFIGRVVLRYWPADRLGGVS